MTSMQFYFVNARIFVLIATILKTKCTKAYLEINKIFYDQPFNYNYIDLFTLTTQ